MAKLTFLIFLAVFGAAIANPLNESKLDGRIIGGNTATKGQFPYQISLQTASNFHFCGGSILNDKWILTAAHCAPTIQKGTVVVVGTTDIRSKNNIKHAYSKVITHPDYNNNRNMANDLALVKIQDTITFTSEVQPIRLPEKDMNSEGLNVVASGWGSVYLGGASPRKLQYLKSRVFDHEECVKKMSGLSNFPAVNSNHLCTFTRKGQGLCHGDSGGPIVANNVQVGIVSLGYPCAKGYPDVNTHVYKFVDWIRKTMEEN